MLGADLVDLNRLGQAFEAPVAVAQRAMCGEAQRLMRSRAEQRLAGQRCRHHARGDGQRHAVDFKRRRALRRVGRAVDTQ